MKNSFAATAAACLLLVGCTVRALDRSVIAQGSDLMLVQEEMVLSNLELIHQRRNALPWQLKIPSGAITVNDTINPSFSLTWPPTSRTAGISPSRSVQLQWNVVPVTDPTEVRNLMSIYVSNVQEKATDDATIAPPTCPGRFFHDNFEEGKMPPVGRTHGSFNGTFIWVRDDKSAEACFDNIVLATFRAAPVSAQDRGLLVPLSGQQTIGK